MKWRGSGSTFEQTGRSIVENGRNLSKMAQGLKSGPMERSSQVTISRERKTEKESLNGLKTTIALKENFKITTSMALGLSNGVTAAFMKVIG